MSIGVVKLRSMRVERKEIVEVRKKNRGSDTMYILWRR